MELITKNCPIWSIFSPYRFFYFLAPKILSNVQMLQFPFLAEVVY